ncbi:MAG: extracellular solute-binding protein [Pseudomonadota bacterium]
MPDIIQLLHREQNTHTAFVIKKWLNIWAILITAVLIFITGNLPSSVVLAAPMHGIAMHGALKYQEDFGHFSYANPNAPKGGKHVRAIIGSFNSLNPLIVKGAPALGLREYVFESLMVRALDEPFSLYGLIAKDIETAKDRSWVKFTLHETAKFSDGKPITVEDVIFSHAVLRDKGRPNHRYYYGKVKSIEKIEERKVIFNFIDNKDQEMPLIIGLMPILPKHHFSKATFDQTTLTIPIGSGPYKISSIKPGTSITYRKDPKYWGNDLNANKGRYNFDEIRFDYFRDESVLFEAFKKGLYHAREESDPARWSSWYSFPALKKGKVRKVTFPVSIPAPLSAFVFNTRRKKFANIHVRKALTLMFNFEWINKSLYHGAYVRTQSFFDRSELSSHGKAADTYERHLLEPYKKYVQPKVLAGNFNMPKSPSSGRMRQNRRKALRLFAKAGYRLNKGQLRHKKTKRPFTFEILSATKDQERLFLTYIRVLKSIGIQATLRQVDSSQFQQRKNTYDYDMLQHTWYSSLSPGNEQNFRWSSAVANKPGSYNYAGVQNPAVDAMIKAIIAAKTRQELISAVRALDRVLLSGHYVIPLFHLKNQWVAHWDNLKHPTTHTLYGHNIDSWWHASIPAPDK